MRDLLWKHRWAAWWLCAALTLGATLPLSCARADAPVEQARARTQSKARARVAQTKPAQAHKPRAAKAPAKPPAKTKKKPAQQARRAAAHRSARKHASQRSARRRTPAVDTVVAQGLDVANGPDAACHTQLRKAGVSFVKVTSERAPDVQLPIRLTGQVGGVEIHGTGRNLATSYLDCRLALTLLRWAPELKAAGVVRVDHYSVYRPDAEVGGTHKPSAHALALAIDAARFHFSDGRILTVLDTWTDKTKGAEPCTARPQQSADERLLRELVCDAARRGIFQTIVTPHHNPEHDNHVHLEISSSMAPTWIH